jgi:hypothetical protein
LQAPALARPTAARDAILTRKTRIGKSALGSDQI